MKRGGSFLIEGTEPEEIFAPEDFTDEHKIIAKTARDFIEGEVAPKIAELEEQKEGLMQELLRKAGELGLLSADIPEEYGGVGLDKVSSFIIAESLAKGGPFPVAFGAHTSLGTLPIVFFGDREQKKKYLPQLASAEKIGSYALTEPEAGSDALNARTTAALSPDGKSYALNGTKQFITNAGYTDVIITYAKIDGDKFTAFIIDRDTEGVSLGPEEKKLGIKGSSTRSIILENAKVPAENLLGEVGKGHVIAFNILNMGRLRLGAGCLGAAKVSLGDAVNYSRGRVQFGKAICNFGLIKNKIAEMYIKTYVLESMVYRTAALIDAIMKETDMAKRDEVAKAIEEYAVECSIIKVFGSEVLDFIVDETLQIFGGYGYSQEYPAERYYRDSRINRIFEGTNEINRLLIPATLMRKAMKGELPLLQAAKGLLDELLGLMPAMEADEKTKIEMAKKIALLIAGLAAQKYMEGLRDEQEILGLLSDICIEIYAMESGDVLRTQLAALRKLLRHEPYDTIKGRRRIADFAIEAGGYSIW